MSAVLVALTGAAQAQGMDFSQAVQVGKAAYGGDAAAFGRLLADAQAGSAAAESVLGALYEVGSPTMRRQDGEAAKWLGKAAEQGEPQAQFGLGVMYANGRGVPQDYAQAVKWFHAAVDRGNLAPCFYLGLFYENGLGVAKNDAEAVKWYTKAAAAGQTGLQFDLAVGVGKGQHAADGESEVISNLSMVPPQALVGAEYNLGMLYWNGRGVPVDKVAAYKWFVLAAGHGNRLAEYNMRLLARRMSDAQIVQARTEAAAWVRENGQPSQGELAAK
jgi:TPR repeat protein